MRRISGVRGEGWGEKVECTEVVGRDDDSSVELHGDDRGTGHDRRLRMGVWLRGGDE